MRGAYDAAVALYAEALRLEPDNPGLFHSLARMHAARQQWDLAANAAMSARKKGVAFELFTRNLRIECVAYRALGRQGEARGLFESAVESLAEQSLLEGLLRNKPHHGDLLACAMAAGHMQWVDRLFRGMVREGAAVTRVGVFPVATLTAWCGEHGAAIDVLDQPQSVALDARAIGSGNWTYDSDPYLIATVPNAEFLCGWDFVVAPTGHLLEGSGYWGLKSAPAVSPHFAALDVGLVAHEWPDEVQDVDEDALFLSAPESFHIGHWIVEFLPRLRAIAGTDLKVAVPSGLPKKHRQFLELFGIGEERIIACEMGRRYRFRNLIVARTGDYFRPNPSTVAYLRKHLARDPAATVQKGMRVFVERGVGSRKIENRAELDGLLAEYQFQVIDLSNMAIEEQRTALATTETIMGVFGTDLICAYFAPVGANVIELIWDPAEDPVVGSTCHLMGLRHQFVVCEEATPQERRWKKDRDLRVDCDLLRRRLADIAGKSPET